MKRTVFRGVIGLWVAGALFFCPARPAQAEAPVSSPVWKLSSGVRANFRDKSRSGHEWVTRGEVFRAFCEAWRATLFGEFRSNLEDKITSRMELGGELGVQPFSWLYLGSGVHQAWIKPGSDDPEWESRALFEFPIRFWRIREKPVALYFLEEFTFNMEMGEGTRNEVGAGFRVPLPVEKFEPVLLLGWRHVDLIHSEDVDQFEGMVELTF
ncbi:MAG: hypothetical protein COV76_01275 [Candidatus Omnitrophica bacterium CG11_big_fil_rev_8_21_14_0_20_64_10]|nr:MAG: hypothetical protein COV76_01275 [Candidatus Omnitrophica bacterium CG11_big_fil_rev_8_21_14_0_20_64_10]